MRAFRDLDYTPPAGRRRKIARSVPGGQILASPARPASDFSTLPIVFVQIKILACRQPRGQNLENGALV